MDMPEISRVSESADIDLVAALAEEIWRQHFVDIVGPEQVSYMLGKFQSAAAIAEQIADGYQYYKVVDGDEPVGYFALVPCLAESSTQLSRIYVKQQRRGSGLGKLMVAFVEETCVQMGINQLWLTVNRRNVGPIAFYEHMGFTKAQAVVLDIGNGFVMDDYKMVKHIGPTRT